MFSLSLRPEDFVIEGGLTFSEAFMRAPGGHYGKVFFARWESGGAPPGGLRVALKVQIGESPDGYGGVVSLQEFMAETQVLLNVRQAMGERAPCSNLCLAYGTGVIENAAALLPTLPACYGLPERPTPPGTQLFLIAMEPLTGGTLRTAKLTAGDIVRCAIDLCSAMDALHGLGYAHADCKSDNVMFDDTGRLVLVDYNCSRMSSGALISYGGPVLGASGHYRLQAAWSPGTDSHNSI
jgi:serine/threonine protein kinase